MKTWFITRAARGFGREHRQAEYSSRLARRRGRQRVAGLARGMAVAR